MTSGNGAEDTDTDTITCAVSSQGSTIIEEDRDCVIRTGSEDEFQEVDGHGGHAWWTLMNVEAPDYAEGAIWQFRFEDAGSYGLEAWVPAGLGDLSSRPIYKVQFDGQTEKVWPDLTSISDGWLALGTWDFAAGGDQWVRLGDNHDVADQAGRRVVFDALRISPEGWQPQDSDPTVPGDSDATGTLDSDEPDSGDRPADPASAGNESEWGCGCATTEGSGGGLVGVLLLGWVFRRRGTGWHPPLHPDASAGYHHPSTVRIAVGASI
jgi:MYXO-CTERM domain-containing protein